MSILDRFSTIVKANINELLDKCEDPSAMIDQYLRDLRENLAEVKKETAGIMAEEHRCKRMVMDNAAEIKKYTDLAKKAVEAGNDGDAKTFLSKKLELEGKAASLNDTYALAKANADKMRQMHDKLVRDISSLESRRSTTKAKMAVAKTQERVNEIYTSSTKASGTMDAFEKMEQKADRMLDEAAAEAELNTPAPDEAAELEKKYMAGVSSGAVEDALAKLKTEMGL